MNVPTLRKDRGYLYWRHAAAWCAECAARVPGRVVSEGPRVYLERACPIHGRTRGLLAETLEHYLARSAVPARRFAAARRPAPTPCPASCAGPCSWHEGPVRRLVAARGPDGHPALDPGAFQALVDRLRAAGETVEQPAFDGTAEDEVRLAVGRSAPSAAELAASLAGVLAGEGPRRVWVEAVGGLPLDALEHRITQAAMPVEGELSLDPDAPLCLSVWRPHGTTVHFTLHAPMDAATLDLTRLLACPVWAAGPERLVPACWAAIREGRR